MKILKEKKDVIDNLVTNLSKKYDVNNLSGLKRISEDNGVIIIQDKEVIIPAVRYSMEGYYYLLIPNSIFEQLKKYGIAHEMGHVMLGHTYTPKLKEKEGEAEAIYFQTKLGYPYSIGLLTKLVTHAFITAVTKPIKSIKCCFSNKFLNEYNNKLIEQYLIKGIKLK